MIIDEKIKIFISSIREKKKYTEKGYICNVKETIEIDVLDLTINSHQVIHAKCDYCERIVDNKYQLYNKNTKNNTQKFCCNNVECMKKKRLFRINEKYSVDNVFQLSETKEKIKLSCVELYGVENPQQNKDIKEKTEQTNLKIYGVRNPFQNELCKEKSRKTCLEKYGVEYPKQNKEISNKFKSYRKSKSEIKIFDYIKENYDGEIISLSKKIIGSELDIFLPELKFAIEFNGIYWHNEITKHRNYHKEKSDLCKDKDIQLFHIWEDDWNYKQDILKSMILNKIGKTTNKIFARKCKLVEIFDNKLVEIFLNENHIQGYVVSSKKIGLYHKDELVSIMCFKKDKNKVDFELCRFCNKINTNVVGGASKLFNYFIKNNNFDKIKTFADRSYSNGDLYYKLGFKFDVEIVPDYSYTINNNKLRSHKFNFRKWKLLKQGFDSSKSEHEIMLERKIYRIYDSGKYRFIYNKQLEQGI